MARRKHRLIKPRNSIDSKEMNRRYVKKILDIEKRDVRTLVREKDNIENTLREYLTEKGFHVYLSRFSVKYEIRVYTAPLMSKKTLDEFRSEFNLTGYNLDKEEGEYIGMYYFSR